MTVGDHGCALDQDEGHFDWICPGCDFTGTNLKYAYPRCPVCGEGMERLDEDDLIDPQDYPL
jgi:rubrerythrin